jgi:hypothetical protein
VQLTSKPAEQAVFGYLFSTYGDLILADHPVYDVDKQIYVSNLRSDYPILFQDDRTLESRFHLLKVPHVGAIYVDKDFKIIKDRTTSRDAVVEKLRSCYKMWLAKAEEIIVTGTAESLVAISKSTHFFDIIDAILGSIYDKGCLTTEEIEDERYSQRLKKTYLYLQLLEGLELVRKSNGDFKPGNAFAILRERLQDKNKEEFLDLLMSHIIKERYSSLRDVFKLTILEPTIHVNSSVYLPEIEEGGAIYRTEESIQHDFRQFYEKPIGILDLRLHLRRLENAKAIERDGKHFFGNETLRKQMIEAKKRADPIMGMLINP